MINQALPLFFFYKNVGLCASGDNNRAFGWYRILEKRTKLLK